MLRILLRFCILTGGLFFTVRCEKDPPVGVIDGCPEVYIDTPCLITFYGERGHQFKAPYFNPNNPNEFVYIEINYDSGYNHLCTYNFLTGEKRVLTENAFALSQPKWSLDNRILFDIDAKVYIINSDGSNQIQLTYGSLDVWPEWVDTNNICFTDNESGNGIFLNLTTNFFDTITTFPLVLADVSNNSVMAVVNGYRDAPDLAVTETYLISFDTLIVNTNNSGHDRIQGIGWHPNNEDIFYTKYTLGIYKVNVDTKIYERVVEGCFGKWYRFFNISPDGDKIIAERIDTYYEDCTFLQTSSIVIMNIDGTNEMTILPQPE